MRLSPGPRSAVSSYLVALAATAAAVSLRWLLDPWLGSDLPFVTLYGAVAAAAWHGGYRPALVATALSFLASNYLFVEPRGEIALGGPGGFIGLVLHLLTCGIIIAFGEARRVEQRRAESERQLLQKEHAGHFATSNVLSAIVESSHDAIISKSLDGVIQSWNAAAEQLLGYTREQAVGRHISLIIPVERAAEESLIISRLQAGERVDHFDTVRLRSDGRPLEVSLTISPVRDESGRTVGASKIMRDISASKEAERRIGALLADLTEADRRKDEFLAMLAHELRNPLAPIRNAAQVLLLKGQPDPDLKWSQEVINRQVQHMARLLDDLLDVSRISHGSLDLRKERVPLEPVIQSAVETSRPLIDRRGHELTVSLPPRSVTIDADPVRLAQVLTNLLNNAAKYTAPGGHIRLTVERRGDSLLTSVKDDGIGIAPEMLPRVFDMFSQAQALDTSQGGVGVGLSLARGLVELHGGVIEAHSEGLDGGSEFIVRLPIVVEERAQGTPSRGEAELKSVRKRRLLIVDDQQDNADSLAMLLKALGHDVLTAYDGERGIAAAAEFKPELALLDLGMPKLNGFDVCRRIRQQSWGKSIFLVALTGWGREDDRRRTVEAGFDHHLVKPADPGALMSLLDSLPPPAAG